MDAYLPDRRSSPATPRGSIPRRALILAGFFAGYLLLDWVSYIHPMQKFNITPWNPQPALAILLLMTQGRRWLPAVFAAILAAEYLVRGGPAPLPGTLLVSAVLALGYAAIASALTGRFAVAPSLSTRRDVLRLVAVVTGGAFAIGLLYIGALFAYRTGPGAYAPEALLRFWIGDSVGILVTLPLLLILLDPARRAQIRALLLRRETLAQAGAIVLSVWAVFGHLGSDTFKYFYLLFLPLMWVAARAGMAGAALATVIVQAAVIVAVELGAHQALTVFELQALLIALAVTGFFLGVTVDERQQAEKELRRSLKLAAAGEMAAALAHELNQPLTALATYAKAGQLLAGAQEDGREQLVGTLQKLDREARRAADVVRRLRDFFSTGAAQLEPVNFAALTNEVVGSFAARAASQGVSLGCDIAQGARTLTILVDRLQIEVVLRNLIANALDAVQPRAGKHNVDVMVEPEAKTLRVTVRDTGPGIRPDQAERLFEAFTTNKATGMGMGLTISRAIVEAHGGRLWVEPGEQGILHFTLPLNAKSHG